MSKAERTQINLNFQILEILGQGSMGEIYKARDTRLNRIVAVKVLLANQFANEEAHLRFKREALAGAQLEHDNIVTTYDFGIHDGRPFLVMGFIEGETLHQRLKREGMLSVEAAIRMIAPIARALAYAHGKNVIHRDITSNNIMIRAEDERPMLIDFGIAQAAYDHRLTGPGESLGTITYMSPEQAKAQEVDYRSDLYSLGVVLYECLTGTLPFQSSNNMVLLSNIRFEPHPPLLERRPDLPPWIAKVVDRCLAKDPADRFQNGNALADALEQSRPLGKKRSVAPPAAVPLRTQFQEDVPIQVDIIGLSTSPSSGGAYALVLGEIEGNRRLPIIIGAFEAQAIALEIEKIQPSRPMTHDLFRDIAEMFGIETLSVVINELRDGTFFSYTSMLDEGKEVNVDMRPADAVAIAVRTDVPIYVLAKVLDEAGIESNEDDNLSALSSEN